MKWKSIKNDITTSYFSNSSIMSSLLPIDCSFFWSLWQNMSIHERKHSIIPVPMKYFYRSTQSLFYYNLEVQKEYTFFFGFVVEETMYIVGWKEISVTAHTIYSHPYTLANQTVFYPSLVPFTHFLHSYLLLHPKETAHNQVIHNMLPCAKEYEVF